MQNPPRQKLILLGATGSIGTQVLDVVRRFPERFEVLGLSAGYNISKLAEQATEFNPQFVCVAQAADVDTLAQQLPTGFTGELYHGAAGLETLATLDAADVMIIGLVGMIGLAPTLAALQAGKRVLTANKETFVAGGHLVQPYLKQIVPIDSEHSAVFQCLNNEPAEAVKTLYLTASGGPFRTLPKAQFGSITKSRALAHPNWTMGEKISIDSATMMNKGLEVIEAHWLFGVPYEKIRIVVHPQSVVHSAVEFCDHSILCQMGAADMHVPIQYAMFYPERVAADYPGSRLDLLQQAALQFEAPDLEKFPCIRLAYEAGEYGQSATTVLNAADEVAVDLFLKERIRFNDIPKILESALDKHFSESHSATPPLADIIALDEWARRMSHELARNFMSAPAMLRE